MNNIGSIQCGKTKECNNVSCIFKLRDCYSYQTISCFCCDLEKVKKDRKKITDSLNVDEVIYPTVNAHIGTNVIVVNCKDYTS